MRIDENGTRIYSSCDEGPQYCDAVEAQGQAMPKTTEEIIQQVLAILADQQHRYVSGAQDIPDHTSRARLRFAADACEYLRGRIIREVQP